ncbi:hypothetical protein B188_06320 [Candidatus Brocadiaceae bacterium B188]|nr:hypothetical protein B188_06320 [Candidatus Brocadiaceae bacterium B188]
MPSYDTHRSLFPAYGWTKFRLNKMALIGRPSFKISNFTRVVRLEIYAFCFIALEMSSPHVFSGNPESSGFTGYPIKAFGYGKTVPVNF